MRKTFLIDTENVALSWLPLLENLEKGDRVLIFFTNKSVTFGFGILQKIVCCKAEIECIECYNSTGNALDFQLVTELGRRIERCKQNPRNFIVVSKDKGFDAVVQYWGARDVNISRIEPPHVEAVATAAQKKTPKLMDKNDSIKQSYRDRLRNANFDALCIEETLEVIFSAMKLEADKRRQAVYTGMRQKYGAQRGTELYRKIQDVVMHITTSGPFPV